MRYYLSFAFQLMLTVNKICVIMEGGVGNTTVPLLITEMKFLAEVRDWSSQVQMKHVCPIFLNTFPVYNSCCCSFDAFYKFVLFHLLLPE